MCTDKGKDEEEKDDCNINQPNQSVSSKHQNEQDKEFLLWSKQHISNSDVDKSKSSNNTFELLNDEAAAVATLTSLSNGADMLPSHENTEKDNSTDEIVIRKRNRERQRRSDLNSQFQTLKSMVKKFEKEDTFSSDISSSSSTSNEGDSSNLKPKNKKRRIHIPAGNIGNRIDLIARTISILERLFETNKSLRNKTKAIKKTLRQAGKNIHKDKTNPNISIDSEIDYQDTTATVEHGGPDASGGEPMNKNYIGNDAAVNQSMNEELMNATIGIMMPHLHANHHRSSVGETITNHDVSTRKVSNENQIITDMSCSRSVTASNSQSAHYSTVLPLEDTLSLTMTSPIVNEQGRQSLQEERNMPQTRFSNASGRKKHEHSGDDDKPSALNPS